ncbi:MAG TPA: DUF4149 domain-containing protein [Pyrinomonadaceae bacterium]|nr:DUF4149 domain-containing protein [Pyrinomonadaceae bacterium]
MLRKISSLLLAVWLGAALLFSAVVAPTVFRVLRGFGLSNASEIAGTIVNHTLAIVNVSGCLISLIVLVLAFGFARRYARWRFLSIVALLAVTAIATASGEWLIAARMRALRAAMVIPIDQVSLADPKRVAFATLHGYSVGALAIAIIAALITFFMLGKSSPTTAT